MASFMGRMGLLALLLVGLAGAAWAHGDVTPQAVNTEGLKKLGFDTGASETPITPVIVGDTAKARKFSARLFEEGVFALSICYPIVARGKDRLRTIVSAGHTAKDLDFALEKFGKVGKELGVL